MYEAWITKLSSCFVIVYQLTFFYIFWISSESFYLPDNNLSDPLISLLLSLPSFHNKGLRVKSKCCPCFECTAALLSLYSSYLEFMGMPYGWGFCRGQYWSVCSIVSEASERGAAGVWDVLWSVSSFSLSLLFSTAGQAAVYRITCGGGNWVQRFGFRTARVHAVCSADSRKAAGMGQQAEIAAAPLLL